MWKKGLALLVVCLVGFLLWHESSLEAPGGGKMYRVGILQLAEHPALDAANKGFVDGLREEGFVDNVILDHQNAQGDQSNLNTIAQRFVARNSDLVVAIATPAVQAMANATKDIPVLGTAVTSFTTARLVDSDEHPGGNVSGTTDMVPMEKRVELVHQLLPNAKKIGTIYSSSEVNSQLQAESFRKEAQKYGMELVEITVSNVNDVPQAANQLAIMGIDAVYFPTDNIIASSYANIVTIFNSANLPVFPSDETWLKTGGLAAYSVDFYRLGVQTGHMAARVLRGESTPDSMPIEMQEPIKFVFNQDEADRLHIQIPESLRQQ